MATDSILIHEKIRYIAASDDPLSADIGIIRDESGTWLYDVGNGEKNIAGLNENYKIVLSHFHADHTGNIARIPFQALYVSRETYEHVRQGTIVHEELFFGGMHIFPLPSSHTKGCLGLEIDQTYAFVGDALYSKVRDGCYIYNAQLLKAEIGALEKLRSPYLLVSHWKGLVRKRKDAIEELKTIYGMREKNNPEIKVRIESR